MHLQTIEMSIVNNLDELFLRIHFPWCCGVL